MAEIDITSIVETLAEGIATEAQQIEAAKVIQSIVANYNNLVEKHTTLQEAGLEMMKLIEDAKERVEQTLRDNDAELTELKEHMALAEREYETRRVTHDKSVAETINAILHSHRNT